jgi:hypothetical protein
VSEPAGRLRDGTLGWHMRAPRGDDCMCPCIATVLKCSIGEVPDPRIDESLAAGESVAVVQARAGRELGLWLAGRGLEMVLHREVPVKSPRWIGVVEFAGSFASHAMVMAGSEVLWDPIEQWQERTMMATGGLIGGAHGMFARAHRPRGVKFFEASDVTCGFTFRRMR